MNVKLQNSSAHTWPLRVISGAETNRSATWRHSHATFSGSRIEAQNRKTHVTLGSSGSASTLALSQHLVGEIPSHVPLYHTRGGIKLWHVSGSHKGPAVHFVSLAKFVVFFPLYRSASPSRSLLCSTQCCPRVPGTNDLRGSWSSSSSSIVDGCIRMVVVVSTFPAIETKGLQSMGYLN